MFVCYWQPGIDDMDLLIFLPRNWWPELPQFGLCIMKVDDWICMISKQYFRLFHGYRLGAHETFACFSSIPFNYIKQCMSHFVKFKSQLKVRKPSQTWLLSHTECINTKTIVDQRALLFQARWLSLHHMGPMPNSNFHISFLKNTSMDFHEKIIVV